MFNKLYDFYNFLLGRKPVGGINESMLDADDKGKGSKGSKSKKGDTLAADPAGQGVVLAPDLPPASASPVVATEVKPEATKPLVMPHRRATATVTPAEGVPRQYQSLRQHISAGQVHLHDDENNLKVAIPVAEWYVIVRQMKTLKPYSYVDTDFNCVANFQPYSKDGFFEIAIELVPITVGDRFKQMADLIKR